MFLLSDNLFEKFKNYAFAVLQAVEEGFVFLGGAEAAAEIEDGVIIVQGQSFRNALQFCEAGLDLRQVGLVGLCVGLVKLIQDGLAVAVTGLKRVGIYVGLQSLGKFMHGGTSWLAGASPEAR